MRLLVLTLSCCAAVAHDSPEHKITDLSSELARSGNSPALLMERAIEHRTLGHLADAAADLEAASRLDPQLPGVRKELSLVQLAQGQSDMALRTINDVLAKVSAPDFLMARAEIQTARAEYTAALLDCEAAFAEPTENLEWYLLRAQLQRRLGKFRECLAGLREGFAKTGSGVLEEEIVDAMIDAGEHKGALKKIERELADSRWRSSWLLKRARLRLAIGETKSARRDLRAALEELNLRIRDLDADVNLIIDRGLAHALLDDTSLAKADLERARNRSSDAFSLWRLESTVSRQLSGALIQPHRPI